MEDYKKRLVTEFRDLFGKTRGLSRALENKDLMCNISYEARNLMEIQKNAMLDYLACLTKRMVVLDVDLYA